MKKLVLPLSVALLTFSSVFGQTAEFSRDFSSVRSELTSWDPVRGEWLASSMEAMSYNLPIPDRNFPEQYTPSQMLDAVPTTVRASITSKINQASASATPSTSQQWNRLSGFVDRQSCRTVVGRSHGDPHIESFDGNSMSFQTVGEYALVESKSGRMRVQVRQKASGESFSLNSAVAMWVDGDRVGFYTTSRPDGNTSTPIRVNGEPVYPTNGIYFLDHGGIITESKGDYTITWPTGERVQLDERGAGNGSFYNVAVEIMPCKDQYEGILGNANSVANDDFDNGRMPSSAFGTVGGNAQKEYLNYLAREFGERWRVNEGNSLFDYGFGQSPLAFYDPTFPRVHYTLDDMDPNRRDRARRDCERRGFSGNDLNTCVFDNGFLNIEPTVKPTPPPTRNPGDVVLKPVTRPEPNVNPGRRPRVADPSVGTNPTGPSPVTGNGGVTPPSRNPSQPQPANPGGRTSTTNTDKETFYNGSNSGSGNPAQPIDKKPVVSDENNPTQTNGRTTTTKPVVVPNTDRPERNNPVTRPSSEPRPAPRIDPPRSEPRPTPPAPRPTPPAPRPTPAPSPRVNPTPAPRSTPSPAPAPRPSSPPIKRP